MKNRQPPFVPPEKRRRVQGGPRGLKDGPPQLDLGGTLDSAEPPADATCRLRFPPSGRRSRLRETARDPMRTGGGAAQTLLDRRGP